MGRINQLTQKPTLVDADIIPVWDSEASRTRAVLASTILKYIDDHPSTDKHVVSGVYDYATKTLKLTMNDSSVINCGQIAYDQLSFTEIENPDIFDFNNAIWANLVEDGKYGFGGNTSTSSNMPPVAGTGAYTCYVWSIGKIGESSTIYQKVSFSFTGSPPEVFERAGVDLASAISNGWAKLS